MRVTVGMGQMLVIGGAVEDNLTRAVRMIERAAAAGCQVAVLPECLNVGWMHPDTPRLAAPIPGPHADMLCRAARAARIHVVAGLAETEGGLAYNAAVLIAPSGEILLKHRKINELSAALGVYATGQALTVAATPLGMIGVLICADNFPGSLALGHAVARMGARLILSPCAWAVEADFDHVRTPYGGLWRSAYGTLADLYDLAVVGVSNVGPIDAGAWRGRLCIGCSLVVGPGGRVLAAGPYGVTAEALVCVEVEVSPPPAQGTELLALLRSRGYEGP